jgi:CRISPR-associated protein (TIGR02710 family)
MTHIYLATLGGAPDPVFLPIQDLPELTQIFLFASPESEKSALSQIESLPIKPTVIHTPDVNDLTLCYQTFRQELLHVLETSPPLDTLLCNITGGTKPMSASLMMLATEFQLPMTYIGGTVRDKEGVGIVKTGTEVTLPQQNPWQSLGLLELRRIKFLWDNAHFAAAAELLQTTGQRLDSDLWLTFSQLAKAHAARLRFDFTTAHKTLKAVRRALPDHHPLQEDLGPLRKTCDTLAKSTSPGAGDPQLLLCELLASSAHAAHQARYEDAAARLYRAIELWAQLHFFEQTGGSYWDGKLRHHKNADRSQGAPYSVPAALMEPSFLSSIRCRGSYPERLGLSELFLALDALQFQPAQAIAADILQGRNHSKFIRLSTKRNESILAHGTVSVTEQKFNEMKNTLYQLIPDFPLISHQDILPPHFQESWLSS